jgi:hypothetical protein
MAHRIFKKLQGLVPEMVSLSGSFAPNGSSAVSATSNEGKGWSVARIAAGHFRLTLERKYTTLISAIATLQLASADDKDVQIGPYDQANRTLDIFIPDISAFANEVQTIEFDAEPDSGAWTITFDGEETESLDYDANAEVIEAAVEALDNVENVTVAGDYASGFSITFVDPAGPVADVTIDGSTLEANAVAVNATVTETTPGVSGADVSADANNRVNFRLFVTHGKVGP